MDFNKFLRLKYTFFSGPKLMICLISRLRLCSAIIYFIQNNCLYFLCYGRSALTSLKTWFWKYQKCARAGVSEWTPAGVLTNFENRSGAGVIFSEYEVTLLIINYYYCRLFFLQSML